MIFIMIKLLIKIGVLNVQRCKSFVLFSVKNNILYSLLLISFKTLVMASHPQSNINKVFLIIF
jgi:hypothetical protein